MLLILGKVLETADAVVVIQADVAAVATTTA
jgi:hypothetical protein